jgi:hypothetical protein
MVAGAPKLDAHTDAPARERLAFPLKNDGYGRYMLRLLNDKVF